MSDKQEESRLKRVDASSLAEFFPVDTSQLSAEKREELDGRLQEQNLELREELSRRVIKSRNAESDMATTLDQVAALDSENKLYVVDEEFETGSGKVKVKIRGGDTKFIVPILVVIGCTILGIVLIFALS